MLDYILAGATNNSSKPPLLATMQVLELSVLTTKISSGSCKKAITTMSIFIRKTNHTKNYQPGGSNS